MRTSAEDDGLDPFRGSFRWAWTRGWKHVDRFVVGVVVFGLAGIVGTQIFKDQPYLVLLVAALAAIVVAFGWAVLRASYEQRNALRVATNELRRQIQDQSPDFVGTILTIIFPPDDPKGAIAFVNMAIVNRGFQSIVGHEWQAVANIGGTKMQARLVVLGPSTDLTMATGERIVLIPADAIYEKGTTPIVRGNQIAGWFRMELPGVGTNEFRRAGNGIEVTFKDFLGKSYVASYVFEGSPMPGHLQYFPGSQNPVPPAPSQARAAAKRNRKRKHG
jgi:hypothetical protein